MPNVGSDSDIQARSAIEAFERDKLAFQANVAQFRDQKTLFWQVPLWALTLTGALWYGAATSALSLRVPFHVVAASLDLAVIVGLYRVRHVMSASMLLIQAFNPAAFPHARSTNLFNGSWSLMIGFAAALGIAAACSLIAILGRF